MKITDRGLGVLGKAIGKHLVQLQQLSLGFDQYVFLGGKINKCGYHNLFSIVLFHIFNLLSCDQISDNGLRVLETEIVKRFPQLDLFALNFEE